MLNIKISSFSYKKSGIPKDDTPNGGGFVFDCRYIYNPGRKAEWMTLTGQNKEIIDFLADKEEMQGFLKNVYNLVDAAVDNYLSRDFTDLMISFGCTGGQHRSVYASEHLNSHLKEKYGDKITTSLTHIDMPK